jgi:hypothetical protein
MEVLHRGAANKDDQMSDEENGPNTILLNEEFERRRKIMLQVLEENGFFTGQGYLGAAQINTAKIAEEAKRRFLEGND